MSNFIETKTEMILRNVISLDNTRLQQRLQSDQKEGATRRLIGGGTLTKCGTTELYY